MADSRAGCWFKALCAVLHSNKPEPSDSHSSATTAWPGRGSQKQEATSHIRTGSNRSSRQGVLNIPTQETRLWEPPCPQRRWSPVVDGMTGDTKPASLSYTRPFTPHSQHGLDRRELRAGGSLPHAPERTESLWALSFQAPSLKPWFTRFSSPGFVSFLLLRIWTQSPHWLSY